MSLEVLARADVTSPGGCTCWRCGNDRIVEFTMFFETGHLFSLFGLPATLPSGH